MVKLSIAECDRILTSKGSILEMEQCTINGRKVRTWKNLPKTFREFLLSSLGTYKERTFLSSPISQNSIPSSSCKASTSKGADVREQVTFQEILYRSLRLATWMKERGLGVGSKIAIGGRNSTGWIVCFVATHLIGAITVLLNAMLPREQLVYTIRLTSPQLVFLDEERSELLGPYQYVRETGLPPMYCWSENSHLPSLHSIYLDDSMNTDHFTNGVGLEDLGPESDAVIFFTSGTSGAPKAVLSTQRMALSNLWSGLVAPSRAALRAGVPIPPLPKPTDPQRTVLLAIPLFHVTGCLSWLMRAFFAGSKIVLMSKWDVREAINLIESEKVSVIGGVPAVVSSILHSPDLPKSRTFDTVFYGGAPPSKQMAAEVKTRWPKAGLVQGYGMTETNAYVCSVAGADYVERPDSTGPPVPICDTRIVDPASRRELPRGEIGLLLVRGPQVMKCYYNDEEATKKAIDTDGWLDTGDVGYMDEEGFLYIKDRLKDIIIRGGENIASADVENALYSHTSISEAVAIGLPDDHLGEVVGAIVSLHPTSITKAVTEDELKRFVIPILPRYALPVIILIHNEPLPRNVNGKVVKKDLKGMLVKAWEERKVIPLRAKL